MSIFNAIKNALLRCEAGYRVIAGIDSSGNPQLFGCSTPTAATGTLTSDNTAPSDGDTVTIGTQVYTARTALTASTTANEVLINSTADAFLLNLIRAINKSGTPGTDYGSLTVKNSDVTAATSVTAHAFVVTAIVAGGVGNNVATTDTSAHLSWGQTTLTGGVSGALLTSGAGGGSSPAGATVTIVSAAVGASGSGTIPIGAKGWTFTVLTGTATFNGAASLPAGFSESDVNTLTAAIAYSTASASSAYVRYNT